MLKNRLSVWSLTLLSAATLTAHALPINHSMIIAPTCLLKNLTVTYKTYATDKQFALIETNANGIQQLINAKQSHSTTVCGGFMDVSDAWHATKTKASNAFNFLTKYTQAKPSSFSTQNYGIHYPTQVNTLLGQMNAQDMWTDLNQLSSFNDRDAATDNGVVAANWIKTQVESMAKANQRTDVTVYTVPTGKYKQPSIVVKIGNSTEAGIVIGGHMDTLVGRDGSARPGADDDGSGSVTVLEVARMLLSSNMQFNKPIYLIWYSAEEEGLIGSQHVVNDFMTKNIPVAAVLQFDMTGYAYQNDPTIWLISDYVDTNLTNYLSTLITTYVKQPVKFTKCGYACSDHATWTQNGFAASMPFETAFSHYDPYIHTMQDKMDLLSLNHISDFAKLAIAFAVELGEPSNA